MDSGEPKEKRVKFSQCLAYHEILGPCPVHDLPRYVKPCVG